MSTKTTNLELLKPELTDSADITAYNENWDKLSKALLTTGGKMEGELETKGIVPIEPITHDIGSPELPFGSIHTKHYNIYSHPDKECGEMSVHITGTTERNGEAVISAGNAIKPGVEGNSRGRVRLFGTDSGYTDVISKNDAATNYEILLPNGNGTLALEGNTTKMITGTYTGDGAETRFIDLGVTPKAVLVCSSKHGFHSDGEMYGGLAIIGTPCKYNDVPTVEIVNNGFNVGYSDTSSTQDEDSHTNASNELYLYIAFI